MTATATLEEADESAWGEIAQHLRQMSPYDFQDLVAALLGGMGYHVSWVSPPGKDRGVDILAYTDPLGAEGPRIKVQVKRRNDTKTTVDDLRSFMAVLERSGRRSLRCLGGLHHRMPFPRPATRRTDGSPSWTSKPCSTSWVRYYDKHPGLRPAAAPAEACLVPLGRRLMRRPDIEAGLVAACVLKCNPRRCLRPRPSSLGPLGATSEAYPVDTAGTWSLGHTYRSGRSTPAIDASSG